MSTSALSLPSFSVENILRGSKYLGAAGLVAFIWEHLARKRNSTVKPSTALNYLSQQSVKVWQLAGAQWARLSSFLNLIELGEFKQTMVDLSKPTLQLIVSPCYSIQSYFQTAKSQAVSNNQKPSSEVLTWIGSILITGVTAYSIYRYQNQIGQLYCRLPLFRN